MERRPKRGEVSSPNKDRFRGEWVAERDLRHEIQRKKERDLREQLKEQQRQREYAREQYEDSRRREHASASRDRERVYTSSSYYPTERKKGYYVRKYRHDHEANRGKGENPQTSLTTRKRRPKQMWVAKDDNDRQVMHDTFIRDTRQKTSTVFDCISENYDRAADPAGEQGHREQ